MRTLLISLSLLVSGCSAIMVSSSDVNKARETEAKSLLGYFTRAEHAYHFENDEFTDSFSDLGVTGFDTAKYYDFKIRDISTLGVVMTADPKSDYKELSGFVGFTAYTDEEYVSRVCKLEQPFETLESIYDTEIEGCY